MRAVLLLLGWGVLCAAIFGDGAMLSVEWGFYGWSGPSPEHTGLIQMWVCAGALLGLVWILRLMEDRISLVGSFLLSLPTVAFGVKAALGQDRLEEPVWFRALFVAIMCSPMIVWLLGMLLRYGKRRLSDPSPACEPPEPEAVQKERCVCRGRLSRYAGALVLVVVFVALLVGQWRWLEWCRTTPPALLVAIERGDQDAVQWALEHGADPETIRKWGLQGPRSDGSTALMVAAGRGDTEMVLLLLGAGADVNRKNRYGGTALHRAALSGSVATVKALLDAKAEPGIESQSTTDPDGIELVGSALHTAAVAGQNAVVELLLDRGMPVDAVHSEGTADQKVPTGNTPLILAAVRGRVTTVELLLKRGADKQKRNRNGRNAAGIVAEIIKEKEAAFRRLVGTDPSLDKDFQERIQPYREILQILSGESKPSR